MTRFVNPNPQFFDNNGKVLANGSLTFYEPGTTNAKTTYSNYAESSANGSNVISLDANGRIDGDVFFTGLARVILKDSGGTTIWDKDNCHIDNALAYGTIASSSAVSGVGLASVSNTGTGVYRLVFDIAAPTAAQQSIVASYQGANAYIANAVIVNETTADIYLFTDAGAAVSATPIGVTRRILY